LIGDSGLIPPEIHMCTGFLHNHFWEFSLPLFGSLATRIAIRLTDRYVNKYHIVPDRFGWPLSRQTKENDDYHMLTRISDKDSPLLHGPKGVSKFQKMLL
jgi:hypothetical protein